MKKLNHKLSLCLLIIILAGLMLMPNMAAAGTEKQKNVHKPITQKLIKLIEKNPEVGKMLEKSIAEAKKTNPDPKTNPVQSLKDYYNFIDRSSELIPREVLDKPSSIINEQILQTICYFYFLVDQPLPELKDKGLYNNTIQYYKPFSGWLREFATEWGKFLDTKESWSEKTYSGFYKDPNFGLQKGWYEPSSNWKTFNRFFSRYLKSPAARPIASPADSSVVVSPADSVPQGVWNIDKDSNIKVEGGVKIKNAKFFSIKELLGKDSKYKDAFAGGTLTHTFLNVFDYHRYHFGVGGTVKEMKIIQQNVALEVGWDKKAGKYVPIDSTGWQFTQTRGYVVMDTEKYGLVVLMPMGMAQVSSVNFEKNVKVGSKHKKGDMLGTFLFGGSDFIMVFQKKAGFKITAPKESKADPKSGIKARDFRHILMGEKFGEMKGQSK